MKWGAIKGLFVETDESEDPKPSKKEAEGPVENPQSAAPPPPPTQSMPVNVSAGQLDQSIMDNLLHALEEANLPGFDYFEFAQILEKLAVNMPAEQMRYQTAFSSAAVMGATKAKLIEAAGHYLKILEKEAEKFTVMLNDQVKENVTDKEASIINIETTIQEKSEMINQLTQEINELSINKTTILNEAAENKVQIEKVQNDFAACLKIMIDKINGDSAKITQYIPD